MTLTAGAIPAGAAISQTRRDPFAGMADGYGRASAIASLGAAPCWRRRLIEVAGIRDGDVVVDMMAGTGEMWRGLLRRCGSTGHITGIDSDAAMHSASHRRLARLDRARAMATHADARSTGLPTGSVDVVTCALGLKTLDTGAVDDLLREVHRILRPGGTFACLEIGVPPAPSWLTALYLYYLGTVMPAIVTALRVDHGPHRRLAGYAAQFGDGRWLIPALLGRGFRVREWRELSRGCAVVFAVERPA